MSFLNVFISITTALLLHSQLAIGEGVFQVQIKSYSNERGIDDTGRCCHQPQLSTAICDKPCTTYFRVCLKEYQTQIELDKCTFGEKITPVFSSLNLTHFEPYNVQFNFSFSWPRSFSLIVEAWQQVVPSVNGSLITYHSKRLILRKTIQSSSEPSDDWTPASYFSNSIRMSMDYRVKCIPKYYGDDCTKFCNPRDDQFGHFDCDEKGRKQCMPGYTGAFCDQPECNGCENGECIKPFTCECHNGWKGAKCDQCVTYPGCEHGVCKKPYTCTCKEGWGGVFCSVDLNYCTNHRPCLNGGTCQNKGPNPLPFECTCPPGFGGQKCELPITNCSVDSNCQNGGTCLNGANGSYSCQCPIGFIGLYCEKKVNHCKANSCLNGGTCTDGPSGFSCFCRPGFGGKQCQQRMTTCSQNPCHNGGLCSSENGNGYKCKCRAGFAGQNCEINIDDCFPGGCLNGGTCVDGVNSYMCQCPMGYRGSACEEKVSCSIENPCMNGGTCRDIFGGKSHHHVHCVCPDSFFGFQCEGKLNAHNLTAINFLVNSAHRESLVLGGDSPGSSGDRLSTGQVALISLVSALVPVVVIMAMAVVLVLKRRRQRKERLQRRDEEEARRQNEENAANMNNKCIDNGPFVIVNNLNRQKSATLSKLTNEEYDYSQLNFINGRQKSATLLRGSTLSNHLQNNNNSVNAKQQFTDCNSKLLNHNHYTSNTVHFNHNTNVHHTLTRHHHHDKSFIS